MIMVIIVLVMGMEHDDQKIKNWFLSLDLGESHIIHSYTNTKNHINRQWTRKECNINRNERSIRRNW